MNIESAKMDFVGGPFDGGRLVIISQGNLCEITLENGRLLVYTLENGKYHFRGYSNKSSTRTE